MKSDFRLPLQNNTMNTDNSKLTAWEKMQLDMIDDDLDEDLFHRRVAAIGCGSIVTHDIPPRTLAAGNPCRIIRPITEADNVGFEK